MGKPGDGKELGEFFNWVSILAGQIRVITKVF